MITPQASAYLQQNATALVSLISSEANRMHGTQTDLTDFMCRYLVCGYILRDLLKDDVAGVEPIELLDWFYQQLGKMGSRKRQQNKQNATKAARTQGPKWNEETQGYWEYMGPHLSEMKPGDTHTFPFATAEHAQRARMKIRTFTDKLRWQEAKKPAHYNSFVQQNRLVISRFTEE